MNKNGWGLRVELAFLLLFLICILISTIGLYRLGLFGNSEGAYEDLGKHSSGSGSFDYEALEKKVTLAAKKYYNDVYPNGNESTIVVTVSTLKSNGYLDGIYDSRNRECSGYAKIFTTSNCVSYIKCSFYKTIGYSGENE